jgi:hypothetical protein
MKRSLIMGVALIILLMSINASAECPLIGGWISDCNLLNETSCPEYYSNYTTDENRACAWNVGLCEENGLCDDVPSSSSSSSSSSSIEASSSSSSALSSAPTSSSTTTTTTLLTAGCLPSELKMEWSVIGLTPSSQEICFYYGTSQLRGCYMTNDTICLDRAQDYYMLIRPSTWDVVENPTGAVTTLLNLARPILGIAIVLMIGLAIVYVLIRMVFRLGR